ncbi:hypothetical protein P692DRAFT_2091933 [Suillus brevipes Sb2]|nr:hypothetical protein P692DRAFT_2091933 [Suillus brevipes Sb2]
MYYSSSIICSFFLTTYLYRIQQDHFSSWLKLPPLTSSFLRDWCLSLTCRVMLHCTVRSLQHPLPSWPHERSCVCVCVCCKMAITPRLQKTIKSTLYLLSTRV